MAERNQENPASDPIYTNALRNRARLVGWFPVLCVVLGTCQIAYGLTVESGYVGLDVSQKGMSLSYGPT